MHKDPDRDSHAAFLKARESGSFTQLAQCREHKVKTLAMEMLDSHLLSFVKQRHLRTE